MSTPSYTFPLVGVPPIPDGQDSTQQRSAIQTLRRSFLLDSAQGASLTVVGGNYGVPRPPQSSDDELFRRLISVLAWQPKTIKFTTFMLLTAVFGSQADIVTAGGRAWQVYEPNANEFVLEIPLSLLTATNENASYLHGWTGYAAVAAGPSNTFTTRGNVTTASATTLVGKTIQVFHTAVWNTYTVNSATYSAITDLTTIVVSASTIPTGGGFFVLDIPGDGVASYPGDFIATSEYVSSFTTAGGPATNTISVLGNATISLAVNHSVVLTYDGADHTYTINSLTFVPATNRTTIVVNAATVTGGLTGAIINKSLEEASTTTTAPHDLRVYLTGVGLLEVVTYYMNLLVRAAGIVMRVELI